MKRRMILAAASLGLVLAAGAAGVMLATPAARGQATPQAGDAGAPPEEFVPTEQVPADTAVSFPVDI